MIWHEGGSTYAKRAGWVLKRVCRDENYVSFKLVGRAKRAPHWGVQSRFRVIYVIVRTQLSRFFIEKEGTKSLSVLV